jgi:hypothetical protein
VFEQKMILHARRSVKEFGVGGGGELERIVKYVCRNVRIFGGIIGNNCVAFLQKVQELVVVQEFVSEPLSLRGSGAEMDFFWLHRHKTAQIVL